MSLAVSMKGRDNNLNLVRFLAAFSVLASHSFVLCSGRLGDEPLRASLGMSLGDLSVDIFFATSGFLVARSLLLRGNGLEFLWARILRIYPALFAMVAGCVLLVFPLFGDRPLSEMLWSREGRHFVFANLTLVRGVALGFTGVFGTAPWKEIVNGSLWTMTYEIRLYLSLVGLWWMLLPLRSLRPAAMRLACLLVAAGALAWHATTLHRGIADPNGIVDPVPRLVLMFYLGAAWWVLAEKVALDLRWLAFAIVAVVLARFAGSSLVFHLAYALALPYAIWVAAFVPAGAIRGFNRIGDCSYGIYIYAFPIQQAWAVHFASKGPWAMMAATGTVAIVLGLVSWHFLEKPAMALKDRPRQLFPGLFGA